MQPQPSRNSTPDSAKPDTVASTATGTVTSTAASLALRWPLNSLSRWPLASLSLSMLLSSLGTSSANVALPTLALAFGASFQQVQWVVLAYLLAITTLIVSVGRLGDLLGRKRLLLGGIALFSVASALCAAAPSLALLIAARALQGLGAATMMALSMAFVADTVPKEKTGSAMGWLGTMSAVGTALGPTVGGALIACAGWPAIFFFNVPLGLLALVLAQRQLPARHAAAKPAGGFDLLGTLLLALTLAAYALSMTLGRGHFGGLNQALLLAAAVGAGLFVWAQSRAATPLLRFALLRERDLGGSLAMGALVSTVVMTTLVVGPFYLAHGLALDAARVGLALSVGPLVVALCGVPAGRLADRYGAQGMTAAGLLAMLVGSLLLALLPSAPGLVGVLAYVGPVAVLTAGYALFQTANNTASMADIPAEQRGVVSGLLNLSRNLGLITGAALMGAVFAAAADAPDIGSAAAPAVASAMHVTFALAAVLIGVALAIALAQRFIKVKALGAKAAANGA